jgi:predicted nucleotidyltransferase
MKPTDRWKQLLEQRLHEAITVLGQTPGLHGLIVAGSVGRATPWPMSDIDLLPIYATSTDPAESATQLDQRRAALVDWWAASGRAQTLDVGWLGAIFGVVRRRKEPYRPSTGLHSATPDNSISVRRRRAQSSRVNRQRSSSAASPRRVAQVVPLRV